MAKKVSRSKGNKTGDPSAKSEGTRRTKESTGPKKTRKPRNYPKKTRESIFNESPVYDLLKIFERAPDQWAARYVVVLTAIILRSCVGLGSYSGEGQDPINGDFEAQRHWMEITLHLPASEWYFFDLQYWGLDYPPLTAFHSFLLGKIGSFFNSSWFALNSSRRFESAGLKTFMRSTSLLSELLIYIPALLRIVSIIGKRLNISRIDQIIYSAILFYLPSLVLIDHGHFQYNSVMLGLFILSLEELIKDNLILASIWFVLSINFKQMALYYAPFIFFYILSSLFPASSNSLADSIRRFNFTKLFLVSVTVIVTNFILLLPFLIPEHPRDGGFNVLKQILIRVFPFQRGLFEDKVSNFWCVSNLFIKYREIFSLDQLTKLSLVVTLISLLPASLMIFFKKVFRRDFDSRKNILTLIYGFAATSWSFFLFSFQVHEKSVLVPLVPSSLLYLLNDKHDVTIIQWISNVATFSMYPLLKKDNLSLQYFTCIFTVNWLIGGFVCGKGNLLIPQHFLWKSITILSYISMFVYHVVDISLPPPQAYPDLWVILNSFISFGCFGLFWLWLLTRIYKI